MRHPGVEAKPQLSHDMRARSMQNVVPHFTKFSI